MKYLLDTNIFLWWLNGDKNLKKSFLDIINNPNNIKFVSVVSIWEIIIKVQAKKLPILVPIETLLEKFEFDLINVQLNHVLEVSKLPNIHKDPFDRLLIAQSKIEDCQFLTTDKKIKKYF